MRKKFATLIACSFLGWGSAAAGERPSVTAREAAILDRAAGIAQTNVAQAVGILSDERGRDRSSAALDYSAGRLLVQLEQFEEAAEAYRAALDKAPEFDEARVGWARALAAWEKWDDAESTLRPLAQRHDAGEDVLLLHGFVLLNLGRVISAESVYRRALLAGGESSEAKYGLARCLMEQGRNRECALMLDELVRAEPNQSSYWALLADAWLAADRPGDALVRLEVARRLEAAGSSMLALLGDLYVNRGQGTEAARVYEEAVAMAPDDASLLLRAAEGLLFAGAADKAGDLLTAYDESVAAHEHDARFYRVTAQWAEQTERTDEARAAYREWVRLEPLSERALLALGDLYHADGDYGAAEMWYERARDAHPQRHAALLRLARVAIDREWYDEAAMHLERALVLSGDPAIDRSLKQVRRLHDAMP